MNDNGDKNNDDNDDGDGDVKGETSEYGDTSEKQDDGTNDASDVEEGLGVTGDGDNEKRRER